MLKMWKFVVVVVFSLTWALIASEGLEDDFGNFELEKPTPTGCNSTLSHNNSRFELNDHTLKVSYCYWTINVTGEIRLFFFNVFLYEKDELNIYKSLEDAEKKANPLLKSPIPSQNGTTTVITNENLLVIYLRGDYHGYERVLEGFYSVDDCSVPVKPSVEILYSPIYLNKSADPIDCIYRFNEIPHIKVMQVFTFEEFNMPNSMVTIKGSTLTSEEYNADQHPTDFFIHDSVLTITVKQSQANSSDHFRLKIHEVDSRCSGKVEFNTKVDQLVSPPHELNNGSITAFECRWLVQSKISKDKLGIKFDNLGFTSVFDIVSVNDGPSEISPPLLQATFSNRNETQDQIIRASGSSLWIAFKPLNYESNFAGSVTAHEQGGYFNNSGEINMHSDDKDDSTAFLLEVKGDEVVMLNFDDSSITPPAVVSVYDGFGTNNLLASLHGQVKFPIISRSSRMMVIANKFSGKSNHFSGKFKGVTSSCNHMSSSTSESYILSENCNSSCVWIIPPQNASNSALVVYLQYIALNEGSDLAIHKLDDKLTQLAKIGANQTYMPHITVPADVGILINTTQAECKVKTEKIVFIGHSSYVPACDNTIVPKTSEFSQISSPLYPDTYPVFSQCHWNISASKNMIAHMTFQSLNLAKNHCIRVSQNSKVINQFEGKILPNDLFLKGDVLIDFDSAGCNKTFVSKTLSSDTGFLLNVTFTDCGDILNQESGKFNTVINGSQSICIWKVSVPPTNGESVNIILYNITEKDKLKNYEFNVYDGSSVRDTEVLNKTQSEIWSRTNTLIFVYKRQNLSEPSGVLQVTFKKMSCDTLCDNKICMHPDWRCDTKNDCGDFTDERNCAAVPIPPEVRVFSGYSATAFWLCLIAMTIIGVILGVTVPVCFQKYRDSRYRRFHELDPN